MASYKYNRNKNRIELFLRKNTIHSSFLNSNGWEWNDDACAWISNITNTAVQFVLTYENKLFDCNNSVPNKDECNHSVSNPKPITPNKAIHPNKNSTLAKKELTQLHPQQHIKKIGFCCPNHGILSEKVEYFSSTIGSKRIIDVSVMRCPKCEEYYTPFTNLLALSKLHYKGKLINAGQAVTRKNIVRTEVRTPYILSIEEYKKQSEEQKTEKEERHKQYIDNLREVDHSSIILTNKLCFINEHRCPSCQYLTKKEYVKIAQRRKYVLSNVRHCSRCGFDYISPEEFYKIDQKANKVIKGRYDTPFISPVDTRCQYQRLDKYLFIPRWALDINKYDYHKLPPRGDAFYDMTTEEYAWVIEYHQPIDLEFPVQLRAKSFLGEAGYSTGESEIRRRAVLGKCVQEHGKWKVINQLKSNMNIRLKQKNGSTRYANAINIWRSDIWYVENKL